MGRNSAEFASSMQSENLECGSGLGAANYVSIGTLAPPTLTSLPRSTPAGPCNSRMKDKRCAPARCCRTAGICRTEGRASDWRLYAFAIASWMFCALELPWSESGKQEIRKKQTGCSRRLLGGRVRYSAITPGARDRGSYNSFLQLELIQRAPVRLAPCFRRRWLRLRHVTYFSAIAITAWMRRQIEQQIFAHKRR
jgi:hypothetical protein